MKLRGLCASTPRGPGVPPGNGAQALQDNTHTHRSVIIGNVELISNLLRRQPWTKDRGQSVDIRCLRDARFKLTLQHFCNLVTREFRQLLDAQIVCSLQGPCSVLSQAWGSLGPKAHQYDVEQH